MNDLDRSLALLASAPLPASLDGLEDRVMVRLHDLKIALGPSLLLSTAGAATFALFLGVAADGLGNRPEATMSGIAGLSRPAPYALSRIIGA